jgi:hypothetical protein
MARQIVENSVGLFLQIPVSWAANWLSAVFHWWPIPGLFLASIGAGAGCRIFAYM